MEETVRQQIEKRAYELFLARQGNHGYHMEDWLQAEREVLGTQETVVAARARKPAAKVSSGKKTAKKA